MRLRTSNSTYHRETSAFTLIEIVLAVGVMSFALVAILGIFPVALQTATNSQRETQAALIARSIFTDLNGQSGSKRSILIGPDTTPISDADSGQPSPRFRGADNVPVDLTKAETHYLAYDDEGQPLSDKISAGDYSGGSPTAGYVAEVKVIAPVDPPGIGLTQVEVTVGAPAAAPEKNRSSYLFTSMLNNGQTPP